MVVYIISRQADGIPTDDRAAKSQFLAREKDMRERFVAARWFAIISGLLPTNRWVSSVDDGGKKNSKAEFPSKSRGS